MAFKKIFFNNPRTDHCECTSLPPRQGSEVAGSSTVASVLLQPQVQHPGLGIEPQGQFDVTCSFQGRERGDVGQALDSREAVFLVLQAGLGIAHSLPAAPGEQGGTLLHGCLQVLSPMYFSGIFSSPSTIGPKWVTDRPPTGTSLIGKLSKELVPSGTFWGRRRRGS